MAEEPVVLDPNESGQVSDVEIQIDSNGGRDALEAGKQYAEVTEKAMEVSETRQTEEVAPDEDKDLSDENRSLAEPTSSAFDNNANPFALPGSQDTLALPSAAQPRRPSTPPRRSKSPADPTSSPASDATITHTTRPLPHSRLNSTLHSPVRPPFEEDEDDGSEDSLMMKPLDSSAIKSTTGGGAYRSRSTSLDPTGRGDVSESSPSRASSARPRSKSPSMDFDIDVENVAIKSSKQNSRNTKASITSRTHKRAISKASQSDREDDEHSAADIDLLAGSKSRKQKPRRRSSFLHVDVPPASSSRNSATADSKRSSQQPASPRHSPTTSTRYVSPENALDDQSETGSGIVEGGKKRRKREPHGFEVVVESTKAESPPPCQSPAASESQTQSSRKSHSVSPPPPSNPIPTPSTQPHPLSELAFDASTQENVVHSSPLSSVPASTPAQRHADSSPSQPITFKRPLAPTESDIEAEASATPNTDTSSPKKKARVPKVTVKDMNPPAVPSSSSTASKTTRKPSSRAKPKKEVASEPIVEEEKRESSETVVGNSWAVRPKRKKSSRKNMREDLSDEAEGSGSNEESEEEVDKDVYSSPAKKRRAPVVKKVKPAKASPRATATGKGKKKDVFRPESRSKGKGKGKAKVTSEAEEEMPAPSSSPAKTSLRPASSFMLQLSQAQSSTRETPAQREKGWDVRAFDDYVWVHVEEEDGKGGFWWLGQITNKLRSERPLLIELFVDPGRTVLDNSPTPIITIDEPSSDNLLQFRSRHEPSKMRFTKETFRDSPTSPVSAIPDDAFDAVLQTVLEMERSFGSDEESDDLPDPSQLGASQRSKKSSQGKRRASSDRESEEEEDDAAKSSESEEESMKEVEEIDKYPFYCLAKVKGQWWPATCVGPALNATNGKKRTSKPIKKYKIEYSDGSKDELARNALLLARQGEFHTVRIEQYEIPVIPGYLENAIEFIKDRCSVVLQRLLDESYPPAQFRNEHFYAGGHERENLAKSVVYGELKDEQTEAISATILEWILPENGERPKGSPRYEALTDSERVTYVADVLLPAAIVLNYVDDRFEDEPNIEGKAREALGERGNAAPTDDEVELEIYDIAYKELNTRSAAKAITSMRAGRKVAMTSKASKKKRK